MFENFSQKLFLHEYIKKLTKLTEGKKFMFINVHIFTICFLAFQAVCQTNKIVDCDLKLLSVIFL